MDRADLLLDTSNSTLREPDSKHFYQALRSMLGGEGVRGGEPVLNLNVLAGMSVSNGISRMKKSNNSREVANDVTLREILADVVCSTLGRTLIPRLEDEGRNKSIRRGFGGRCLSKFLLPVNVRFKVGQRDTFHIPAHPTSVVAFQTIWVKCEGTGCFGLYCAAD
jgi:hypothetical protein